ncbi:DUF559 domain-containing protein [Devosia sp. MC1541]|uniref:endonuclease domain-containing protein n=1 Tax=Devosia sp. MC1541 TaxID=2725264 RepID=UPI00145E1069|nr:DUF559 domain-containing protein [Devosia sp. MC1541]
MSDGGKPAQGVRRYQTMAERRFWALLYPWRVSGWHFRRQGTVGAFVADVVCKRGRVVFDIVGTSDGDANAEADDSARNARLAARGYRVVRFSDDQLRYRPDWVTEQLNAIFSTTWPTDIAALTRQMAEVLREG